VPTAFHSDLFGAGLDALGAAPQPETSTWPNPSQA
jgi:hypothetical protein